MSVYIVILASFMSGGWMEGIGVISEEETINESVCVCGGMFEMLCVFIFETREK